MLRKMSVLVSLMLVVAILFSACAPQEAAPVEEAPAEEAPAEEAPAAEEAPKFRAAMVTDLGGLAASEDVKGFSDLGWDALKKAEAELGIEITLVESTELAQLEPNLTKLASEGYDFVVGVGYLFTDAMAAVAPRFPDVNFAIVDSVVEAPNVASLIFAEEEGSFLVGAIAAGMSKTGIIGFIGGMEGPLIEKFEAGYIAGARSINPDIKVLSGYTGNFTDVASGKELALTQFRQGADVIYAAAGSCGLGTIEAAKENGFWAIGVDTDQDGVAPGHVLTSMLKHVEVAVYDSLKSAYDGNFKSGVHLYDLAAGGVGYSELKYTRDQIPPELLEKVDALAERIKADEFDVPTTRDEAYKFELPS
ncbi:MAG: BMP family ABC transporter substrate-binding protein [Pelolinea sp.]|nr:BMP family ABC transporter substrate-binding protein [Pelolinea sp.]